MTTKDPSSFDGPTGGDGAPGTSRSDPPRPFTFVVKAADGTIIDCLTEEDLMRHADDPECEWREALAWAYIACKTYGRML